MQGLNGLAWYLPSICLPLHIEEQHTFCYSKHRLRWDILSVSISSRHSYSSSQLLMGQQQVLHYSRPVMSGWAQFSHAPIRPNEGSTQILHPRPPYLPNMLKDVISKSICDTTLEFCNKKELSTGYHNILNIYII